MKILFDNVSARCSKITTESYSTSFSLGILLLAPQFRNAIYAIYGFVRFADEIVDSFHDYDKKTLLEEFRKETYASISRGISVNPILNSFQHTVNKYKIEMDLIDSFLQSMEMDLEKNVYDTAEIANYIVGSAEVVGLMCLYVFCNGDKEQYNKLKAPAMKLGAAFQKINFLRDLKHDQETLGRCYFPNIDFKKFNHRQKQMIEEDIDKDFKQALEGIRDLPKGSRLGVYVAYVYYTSLYKKIRNSAPEMIMSKRIRVANTEKIRLLCTSYLYHNLNIL